MTPAQMIKWHRAAAPGERTAYWTSRVKDEPPEVFHTARQMHNEGRVLLYQRQGVHCAQKLSTRAKRFVDAVSASVETPPMGPFGLYAAGLGPDPRKVTRELEAAE